MNGEVEGSQGSNCGKSNNHSGRFGIFCVLICVAMVVSLCPNYSAADSLDSQISHQWWLDLGLGFGGFRNHFAVASDISFSYQNEPNQFTIRFNHVSGITTLFGTPSDVSEYGFLYGRVARINDSYASVSVGLGVIEEKTARLGIPLEAGLYAGQLKYVGISIKACVNIAPGPGPSRSYWTLGLGLLVGKLQ